MQFIVKSLILALLTIGLLSSVALGSPTYVGSWTVDQGPFWSPSPNIYSGQQAAALLFGGNASDYSISTVSSDPLSINHLAWYSSYGSGDPNIAAILPNGQGHYPAGSRLAENAFLDSNLNGLYDGFGDYSAYVRDWAVGNLYTNYAFRNDAAPVPEPGTIMLLGAGFLGLAVYGKRRKA